MRRPERVELEAGGGADRAIKLVLSAGLQTPYSKKRILFLFLLDAVTSAEPVNATCGVNELLLACKEGVTLSAYLHFDMSLCRARCEAVSASAFYGCFDVIGMYALFHLGNLRKELVNLLFLLYQKGALSSINGWGWFFSRYSFKCVSHRVCKIFC